ncbi:exosome complex component MTR3 [Lepeophtheirus salmonis]|uniref:exosome complex component MTR3 n=1 Tax=Lepeophtheirus salmonis TaxID=72036 RepID=UPI001AE665C2|nr:exosome complex component MTR3-like [Lepeophtheirus salmonis]
MNKKQTDFRRFQSPSDAKDYRIFLKNENKGEKDKYRLDGERLKDSSVRSLFCEVGVLTKCKGSAYIERGLTKVIASVFGPREIQKKLDFSSTTGILSVEYKETAFASRDTSDNSNEKNISLFLAETLRSTVCLHLYPKSKIDVFITVLENDGSAVATAITAASLALSDASINLFDLAIGSSVRLHKKRAFVDPCKKEEGIHASITDEENDGNIVIGYQPSLEQIVALLQDGIMEQTVLSSQIQNLIISAKETLPMIQECLIESLNEKLSEINTSS